MKKILVFGAGKSATVLIDYLIHNAAGEKWELTVADADIELARAKTGSSIYAQAVAIDINDGEKRNALIAQSDMVISLLPPALHIIVAMDCVKNAKNLLTASYIDDQLRALEPEIKKRNLIFLCETGLDPGIDHMSEMKIIDLVTSQGGKVSSFQSHCGGLVAPESDDNPWHYKISWNPKSVVLAGKAGAIFRENGLEKHLAYDELFSADRLVEIEGLGFLSWYPNRDSLGYAKLYGLDDAETFVRTTLRHPDFIYGWKNLVDLKLTDESQYYETDGKTFLDFFREHMDRNGFSDWLQQKLSERFEQAKELLENLTKLLEAEEQAIKEGEDIPENVMMVRKDGAIEDVPMEEIKNTAAGVMAHKMHEANLTLKQLFFLGMDDDKTQINKGRCSAAGVLQFALENKLALRPHDRDMIVMLHEMEYELGGQKFEARSSLIVKGEDNTHTAMARTVGLPLGIAAKHILNGVINITGLVIPIHKEIYEPVLNELAQHGIKFREEAREVN